MKKLENNRTGNNKAENHKTGIKETHRGNGRKHMLGEVIHNLRKSRNLSQVDVARELGVSKQSVSNWENDNILPSIDMLIKIAQFFSVSTDYLLELDVRSYLEVSGLTLEQLSHIQMIINDLRKNNDR
jgi:transcriptional regulator with XRE-family HTH domain